MLKKMMVILFVMGLLLCSGIALAEDTLNIIIWPGYTNPDLIASFEEDLGVEVELTEIGTYDEMVNYIDENPGVIDLIIFGELIVPQLIEDNKIQPLNKSYIPNISNADPMFLNLSYDPGNKYTLPYHYLYIGLAYNQSNLSYEEATLQNYYEPSEKLRGRIITFPEARYNVGLAMKYMGNSFNSMDSADLNLAKMLLENMKGYINEGSDSLDRDIYQPMVSMNEGEGDLTIWYFENAATLDYILGGLKEDIAFKIPEEGAMIGTDAFCIPTTATDVKLAHDFINYMYDPQNAAKSVEYLGYAFPVTGVAELIDPELADRIYIPMDILRKCEFPVPLSPEEAQVYTDIWNEVF